MPDRMKKHRTKTVHFTGTGKGKVLYARDNTHVYAIPQHVAKKYIVPTPKDLVLADEVFAGLNEELSKKGALLKGLRVRENLTQEAFAERIGVSQANLSKMEHGKRPIGKLIAKRISDAFGIDYRYFLD